jgi:hypothetical protein
MEEEIWKTIEGFPDYQVSNLGRVKSLNRRKKERFLSYRPCQDYVRVCLNHQGKQYHRFVHRLVASAFIPNPENKPEVDHLDRDRRNNIVSNLRWATHQENSLNRRDYTLNKHIYFREKTGQSSYYEVQIVRFGEKITDKCFKTLEEAIEHRNSILSQTQA